MPPIQLILLAVGLAMDAFAVAVSLGLGLPKFSWRGAFVVGGYFGFFQAAMPVAGFFAGRVFADAIAVFDTWLVFALLVFLGGKMIWGACHPEEETRTGKKAGATEGSVFAEGKHTEWAVALGPRVMLPFALATSIDALAVGVSFAFLHVNIWAAAGLIGAVTFVLSAVGVKIGAVFGEKYKARAAIAGGVILILIGLRVLAEGLFL